MNTSTFSLLFGMLSTSCSQKEEYASTAKETAQDLFLYAPDSKINPPYGSPAIVEIEKVQVRRELLDAENIETVTLNLFDGVRYTVQKEKKELCQEKNSLCSEGEYILWGRIPDSAFVPGLPDLYVTFVVTDKSIGALIPENRWNTYIYTLGRSSDGLVITKLDQSKFPSGATFNMGGGDAVLGTGLEIKIIKRESKLLTF